MHLLKIPYNANDKRVKKFFNYIKENVGNREYFVKDTFVIEKQEFLLILKEYIIKKSNELYNVGVEVDSLYYKPHSELVILPVYKKKINKLLNVILKDHLKEDGKPEGELNSVIKYLDNNIIFFTNRMIKSVNENHFSKEDYLKLKNKCEESYEVKYLVTEEDGGVSLFNSEGERLRRESYINQEILIAFIIHFPSNKLIVYDQNLYLKPELALRLKMEFSEEVVFVEEKFPLYYD